MKTPKTYHYRDTVTGKFISAKKAATLTPECVVREEVKIERTFIERLRAAFDRLLERVYNGL